MSKVLIIDDDKISGDLVSLVLGKEQIESDVITNPLDALRILENGNDNYDLILLDIMMPDISGTELCLKIRDKINIPIVFLSSKEEIIDKMLAYEVGGDDYIIKPFDSKELILKVKSYIRMNRRAKTNVSGKVITIGEISLNEENLEVTKRGKSVVLSTREYELLKYLMKNAGISLSKEKIFESVWGFEYGDIGTVAVNIKSLRDKLEDNNKYIVTIWGYGYKFVKDLLND